MKNIKSTTALLTILLCCTAGVSGYAQSYASPTQDNGSNAVRDNNVPQDNNVAQPPYNTQPDNSMIQPDNTKTNMRDRNAAEVTADQQKENSADRGITARIRKSIVEDKTLSSYAHNIKVITQGGIVTLKGPVRSTHERQIVISKARAVAGGADRVNDKISIKRPVTQ